MGLTNVCARVANTIRIVTGTKSDAGLDFWSVQFGHIGLAGLLGGVGVIAYHRLQDRYGWMAFGCGIIFSWLGSLFAHSRK